MSQKVKGEKKQEWSNLFLSQQEDFPKRRLFTPQAIKSPNFFCYRHYFGCFSPILMLSSEVDGKQKRARTLYNRKPKD